MVTFLRGIVGQSTFNAGLTVIYTFVFANLINFSYSCQHFLIKCHRMITSRLIFCDFETYGLEIHEGLFM
jgi:hypothetical protein